MSSSSSNSQLGSLHQPGITSTNVAHLHRSAGEGRLLSDRIWLSHLRLQQLTRVTIPSRKTSKRDVDLAWRVRWATVSSPSLATWPKRLLCLLIIRSVSGGKKSKGSPYSIAEHKIPELIQVLGSQPAGDVSHKPRLPLLSIRPTVTLATLKRAATNFAAW